MGILRRNQRDLGWLEDELRTNAPAPPQALIDEAVRMVGPTSAPRPSSLGVRRALALAFAVVAAMSIGLLGGFSYVAHAANSVVATASTAIGAPVTHTSSTISICRATGTASNPYVQETVAKRSLAGVRGPNDLVPAPAGGCPASKGVLTSFNSSQNGGGSGGDNGGGNNGGGGDNGGGNNGGGNGGGSGGNGGGEGGGGDGGGEQCGGSGSQSDDHDDGGGDDGDEHCGGGSGDDQYGHGIPICHRTGSTSHPWVLIIVPSSALPAHAAHGDIIPAPPAGCPTSAGGGGRTTSTNFSVNPTTPGVGDRISYVIHVTATPSGLPIGAATCYDDTQQFDSTPVLLGVGLCTETVTSGGPHTIKAVFIPSDQTQFSSSVSANVIVNVAKTAATATLVSSASPTSIGAPVTFTAAVAGPTGGSAVPTGNVQFFDGAIPLGAAVALASGTATLTTSALAAGSHAITVAYAGDATYGAATSAVTTQVVHALSQVVLTTSVTPSAFGAAVTFTATVSPQAPATAIPTGTIQFLDGTTPIGTATLASGVGTLATSALTPGAHSITAAYAGNGAFDASTSASVGQVVGLATPTIALTTSGASAPVGANVTFTATLGGPLSANPTGSVQFRDGATTVGSGTLSTAGVATFSTTSLTLGTHSLTAVYAGDTQYTGRTSSAVAQTIVATPTSIAYTGPTTGTYGQPLNLNATLTNGPSGASVTYAISGGGGTVTGTVGAPTPITAGWTGVRTVTIRYAGDAGHLASSATANVTVNVPTSIAVTSSVNPSAIGQTVTISAALTAPTAIPSGALIAFSDGGNPLSSATANAGGTASISLSSLSPGLHTITATYAGNAGANVLGSTGSLSQTVNKLATSVSYTGPTTVVAGHNVTFTATTSNVPEGSPIVFTYPGGGTMSGSVHSNSASASTTANWNPASGSTVTVSYAGDSTHAPASGGGTITLIASTSAAINVSASPNPVSSGQPVTLNATLSSGDGTKPVGTVTFTDNTVQVATATLSGSSFAASATYTPLGAGAHAIVATFASSNAAHWPNATSAPYTETVGKLASTIGLATSATSINTGGNVTFTATAAPAPPFSGTPSGTVQFFDGAGLLGTRTLASGVATFSTTALGSGPHSITAVYSGDATFDGKTSSAVSIAVGQVATTTALSITPSSPQAGNSVTITALVTAGSSPVPTGAVTFSAFGFTIGTATLSAGGQASVSVKPPVAGTFPLTGSFAPVSGSSYQPSTGSLSVTVRSGGGD